MANAAGQAASTGDELADFESLVARLDALEAEARSLAGAIVQIHEQVLAGRRLRPQQQRTFRKARSRLERLVSVYEAGSDVVDTLREAQGPARTTR